MSAADRRHRATWLRVTQQIGSAAGNEGRRRDGSGVRARVSRRGFGCVRGDKAGVSDVRLKPGAGYQALTHGRARPY